MTATETAQQHNGRAPTLDDLFRRAAVRNPDAPALIDPANRASFTDSDPLNLTFAQADRIVWAIAARLRALGLNSGDIIATQLPNTAESILTLLGILRAGMVAALVPMLWRERDIVAGLSAAGAKAIVTIGRIGATNHCDIAMRAAAQLYAIRHVCAFGQALPDGITPLDDVLATHSFDVIPMAKHDTDPAAQIAVITFDVSARGIVAVPRTHLQVMSGGLSLVTAAGQQSSLLSPTPISSFAGLCVTLVPWLLSGGRLVLHQPFDAGVFAASFKQQGCSCVVLPAPLVPDFAAQLHGAKVVALRRPPDRADDAAPAGLDIVDVRVFGEAGLIATSRLPDRTVAPLAEGNIAGALDLKRTERGTLALRGPMAPHADDAANAFVDTAYPCRLEAGNLLIGARPGLISIGGYAIPRSDLDTSVTGLSVEELITSLPDDLLGERIAGSSTGRTNVDAALNERGISPLVAGAFRPPRAA